MKKLDFNDTSDPVFVDPALPTYSWKEEKLNTITHGIGLGFAFIALVLCVVFASIHNNTAGIITGIIYGLSMICVYAISSVYHGLNPNKEYKKKVAMRVLDHCDIYGLIVGTFAPIAMTGLLTKSPVMAWVSFSLVCVTAVVGITFTAIDMKRFKVISYGAYFVAGWSVLITVKQMLQAFDLTFILLIVGGGAVYTLGMIFYVLQKKGYKYAHGIFHLFILAGSIIQFIPIFLYCM